MSYRDMRIQIHTNMCMYKCMCAVHTYVDSKKKKHIISFLHWHHQTTMSNAKTKVLRAKEACWEGGQVLCSLVRASLRLTSCYSRSILQQVFSGESNMTPSDNMSYWSYAFHPLICSCWTLFSFCSNQFHCISSIQSSGCQRVQGGMSCLGKPK